MTTLRGWLVRLSLLALAATPMCAQQAPSAPSPDLAGIAHVAIRVKNLDASVAFYEKLGFVKAFALSRDGAVYEAFIKIGDRQFLELYPATEKEPQIGFLHLCFEGGDLNAVHDFYVAHGLTPTVVRTAGAGNLLFTMPGPDSPTGPQNMEYTQYMPGSLHSKDFGQHLGPERLADKLTSVSVALTDPVAASSFYREKLGFTALQGSAKSLALWVPGGSQEKVYLAPASSGFRARIELHAVDLPKTGAKLKERGIDAVLMANGGFAVTDPDGNSITLTQ